MTDLASSSRTKIFADTKQDTLLRFCLLSFGTFITCILLLTLLQVNFDSSLSPSINTTTVSTLIPGNENTTAQSSALSPTSPPQTVSHRLLNLLKRKPETILVNVKKGDTLSKLLSQSKIEPYTLETIEALPQVYNEDLPLIPITPGEKIKIVTGSQHHLDKLVLPLSSNKQLVINNTTNNHYRSEILDHNLIEKTRTNQTIIHDSLYQSARQKGLSSGLIMGLTHIFDPDINFKREVHSGDSFKILYVERYKNGKAVKSGPILAAQITLHKKTFTAFRSVDKKGHVAYYTAKGKNLQKAFLRVPVHYVYISSSFDLHRYHPILHLYRPHYGVDLAANRGTPIHAASDGIIHFEGRMGGYGNVIIIRHSRKYSTRYAHMERFAKHVKRGSHVKEGEVIGYVGMTGLATGPHVHYEFRINGKPVNPIKVKLPLASPIPRHQRAHFLRYANDVKKRFFDSREIH